MAITDFVVAIEIASSNITGIAGKRNADGSIQILAKESENSADCIKKGAIFNLDKTTQLLSNIIKRLEDDLTSSIKKIYIGISGKSLRSIVNPVTREFSEGTKVSQALIDNILQSNKDLPLVDMELLYVEPQEYKIGNDMLTDPVGINAEIIEAKFVDIIARPALKDNIVQCFRHTGCEIADFLISPVETANVILSDSEKRSGCVLVDMGAETTTVSIYKNNILRHLAVIPLGGKNITKDIASLQIEEYEAEVLKLKCGSAYTEESDDPEHLEKTYNLNGKFSIEAIKLENIIEARVNEIITNVNNQISLSNYGDKLMAGAILTGGAANLPNMDVAFRRITKIEQVRIAKETNVQTAGIALAEDGTNNTLIGLLSAGKENCCRINPKTGPTIDFSEPTAKSVADETVKPETETATVNETPVEPVATPITATAERTATEPEVESATDPKLEIVDTTHSDHDGHIETAATSSHTPEVAINTVEQDSEQVQKHEAIEITETKQKAEADLKEEENQRRRECQIHINKVANFIETRRYSEALGEIKLARAFNIANKELEINSLEREATRLMDEAEKLAAIREKKRIRELEQRRRAKEECERIIAEAEELLEEGDKKEAEKKAKEAEAMHLSEFEEKINDLLELSKPEPKKKGYLKSIFTKIIKGADDIMKDND